MYFELLYSLSTSVAFIFFLDFFIGCKFALLICKYMFK